METRKYTALKVTTSIPKSRPPQCLELHSSSTDKGGK